MHFSGNKPTNQHKYYLSGLEKELKNIKNPDNRVIVRVSVFEFCFSLSFQNRCILPEHPEL